ncbi:hypothetical protein [Taibaiella soli]|uniref:DUF1795 domain-containing protein n=1 Tax=Taibaiella soli TaxID=1649169 RepID=A0A2W2ACI3_9BACT|nr:hypothetical protein [Taibaiella soli]PZF71332.1 hypothetical protein DN068_18735 [Taibaiella soli]
MPTDTKRSDWVPVIKWLVIGVVILLALLIFKNPIARLLDRANDVEFNPKEGVIAIKTTQTPVGELKVSSEKVSEVNAGSAVKADHPDFKNNVTSDYVLGWPPETWMRDDGYISTLQNGYTEMGVNAKVLMYCRQKVPNNMGFTANVFVTTMPYDNRYSFEDQVKQTERSLETYMNAQVVTDEIDAATKGATIIINFTFNGVSVYQIQRYGYKDGNIMQVVATTTVDDTAAQAQIKSIVNSFRIVE